MSHNRQDLYSLISLLADGQFHSGAVLGEAIGVTRAAVWKRLQQLPQLGLTVESVKGQGYRLRHSCTLLNVALIRADFQPETRQLVKALRCFTELDSTNSYLLGSEGCHGAVCLAEWQSAGRGRRGRTWYSPFAANLYLSVRWHFDRGAAALDGLSLAVGVLLAELLESMGIRGLELKWPNDLIWQGKKLGGILIEVGGDLTGECFAVIGIGLNMNMSQYVEPGQIDQPWVDLRQLGVTVDRNALAAQLLNRLIPALQEFQGTGFATYQDRWMAHAAYLNQQVALISPSGTRYGIFRGVDEHGSFAFDCEGQIERVCGGEISVRGAARAV